MKYLFCLSFLTTLKCIQPFDSHSNLERYPSYVHLEIEKEAKLAYCGGVYIHTLWILTAAHCLVYNEDGPPGLGYQGRVKATMGTINHEILETGQKRKSRLLIIHEDYISKHVENLTFAQSRQQFYDLGLVKIKEPFQINKFVEFGNVAKHIASTTDYLVATGVALSEVSFKLCKTIKSDAHINCKSHNNSPMCDGAPVYYNQTREVVGILSICPDNSTFITNIITYRKWIEANIKVQLK